MDRAGAAGVAGVIGFTLLFVVLLAGSYGTAAAVAAVLATGCTAGLLRSASAASDPDPDDGVVTVADDGRVRR